MSQQEQRPDPLLQAEQQQLEEIPVDEKAIGDQEEEEQINAANLEPDSSPTPSPSSSAQVVEDDKLLSILGGDRISSDEDQGGSVHPRSDCPHMQEFIAKAMTPELANKRMKQGCMEEECSQRHKENWICCACNMVGCSRYVEEHMAMHAVIAGHLIALSLQDLQVWCYGCNSYITGPVADAYTKPIHQLKQAALILQKYPWVQRELRKIQLPNSQPQPQP